MGTLGEILAETNPTPELSEEIESTLSNGTLDVFDAEKMRLVLQFLYLNVGKSHQILRVIQTNSDNFFLTVNAVFILMMQAGFGFFEAGSIRSKNVVNMLFKNILDAFFGGMAYWMIGYALAFGEPCNEFVGMNHFLGSGLSSTLYSHWFFHYSFCVTAATIVSGAVAERCEFKAYLVYSLVITGITYPVVTHWAWHQGKDCEGWLLKLGYQDFAGSGVVHMTGGTCALIACLFLGPRTGRFPKNHGDPYDKMPPHHIPFVVLGAFLLFVGFFAFNGGSQASISVDLDGEQAGRAMMNTVLAGSPAAITGVVLCLVMHKSWDIVVVLGSGLAGMVAICAGCNQVDPWAAILIGVIAAVLTYLISALMKKMKIDDPVDAVALHLGSGLWGVLSTPLFDRDHGIFIKADRNSFKGLAYNLVGAGAIMGWCAVTCVPIFAALKMMKWLRVSPEVELKGLDIHKHGEVAYPEFQTCRICTAKIDAGDSYEQLIQQLALKEYPRLPGNLAATGQQPAPTKGRVRKVVPQYQAGLERGWEPAEPADIYTPPASNGFGSPEEAAAKEEKDA